MELRCGGMASSCNSSRLHLRQRHIGQSPNRILAPNLAILFSSWLLIYFLRLVIMRICVCF